MSKPNASYSHRWRFFRAGGLDQVRLETAEDYRRLSELDQKLWVALACPVRGTEIDEKTLALLDTDRDGRVRVREVLAAIQWVDLHLKDITLLKARTDTLPLDQINDSTPSGQAIAAAAREMLQSLGRAEDTSISLPDVLDTQRILAATRFNGDGVITVESADDPAHQQVIQEIMDTVGSEVDRSGRPGVTMEKVDAFFAQLASFEEWSRKAETDVAELNPLGDASKEAYEAWSAVRLKVDDYFARSRLAAFDSRALSALNPTEQEYAAIGSKQLQASAEEIASLPLAQVQANEPLPLKQGINPAWADAIARLEKAVITPLLGENKASLTEAEWGEINRKMAPLEAWTASKPQVAVEGLGLPRIRELLASTSRDSLAEIIARDLEVKPEFDAFDDVEKLLRYVRDLHRLLHNFVNFAEFYEPGVGGTFQVGILYLDARACQLCVRVDDPAKHALLAGMAKTYLAYCDCTRPGGEKMSIAAAFTNGDSDNLFVGRNGLFYDTQGRDWDATITKVVDNPISIRQAFWAPYKKLVRLIEEQVAKRAAAAESGTESRLAAVATATTNVDKAKPVEAKRIDVGTVAALGVAFGAIGTAIATVAAKGMGLIALPFWQVVLVLLVILLLISGPSMLIAWLKLRQRNLGPILDANGWAVNGRVRLPVSLGRSLTTVAQLPPGTIPSVDDRFPEPPAVWPKLVLFAVILGFIYSVLNDFGFIYKWSSGKWGRDPKDRSTPSLMETLTGQSLSGTNAPAAEAAPPAPDAAPAEAPAP